MCVDKTGGERAGRDIERCGEGGGEEDGEDIGDLHDDG